MFSQSSDTALYNKAIRLSQESLLDADSRQLDNALSKALEALAIFERQETWGEALEAMGLAARFHFQLGNFEEAERFHIGAKEMADQHQLSDTDWSINWYFLAGTFAHERQEYGQAIAYFEKTLQLINDTSLLLAPAMDNADAEAQRQARLDFQNFGIGATKNYMAFSYRSLGDFDKTLDAFFSSLAAFKKCPPIVEGTRTKLQVVNEYGNIASTYLILNQPDEADHYYQLALKELEEEEDSLTLGAILFSMTNVESQKGDYEAALALAELVTGLFERGKMANIAALTSWNEQETFVSVIARKAWLSAKAGHTEMAVKSLEQASSLLRTIEMNRILGGMTLFDLGHVNLLLGQPGAALECFQKGLSMLNEEVSPTNFSNNPDPVFCNSKTISLRLLEGKTTSLYQMGKLEQALAAVENAVQVLDQMRGDIAFGTADGYSKENTLLELEGLFASIFSQNIQIALDLSQGGATAYLQHILVASEKSKTYSLRQAIRRVKDFSGVPADVREEQDHLVTKINLAEKMLSKAYAYNGPERQSGIELQKGKLIKARNEYSSFIKKLQQDPATSRYFNFQVGEKMPGVEDIRREILKEGSTGIIEFYESESHIQAIVIGQGVFEVVSKAKTENWEAMVAGFQRSATDLNLTVLPEVAAAFTEYGYQLFTLLLQEPLRLLGNEVNRLIIVPHGSVNLVDVELLPQSLKAPSFFSINGLDYDLLDFSAIDYVVNRYALSYIPSIAILANELKNQPQRPMGREYSFIGFAPTYAGVKNGGSTKDNQLDELPDEVTPLALGVFKHHKKLLVTAEKATEARYLTVAKSSTSAIIHISAHGELDDGQPLFSKLLFADYNEGEAGMDGQLEVAELYNLNLETDLAVLSACNTGSGGFAKPGEGRISLARGFAYAGCPSIVMGLWKLDAKANMKVVEWFYEKLVEGLPIDQALRQAKLSYIENIRQQLKDDVARSPKQLEQLYEALHPYFWGGMVPFGRMDALPLNP